MCEKHMWVSRFESRESMTLVCIVSYYSWAEDSPKDIVRHSGPGEVRELGLREHRFLTQDPKAIVTGPH